MIRLYLSLALTVAALAGVGYVRHLIGQNTLLTDSVAALEDDLRVQADIAAQAALARDVARAEAARQSKKAAEYDAIREALLRGDEDAELPEWFIAHLGRLHPGAPR